MYELRSEETYGEEDEVMVEEDANHGRRCRLFRPSLVSLLLRSCSLSLPLRCFGGFGTCREELCRWWNWWFGPSLLLAWCTASSSSILGWQINCSRSCTLFLCGCCWWYIWFTLLLDDDNSTSSISSSSSNLSSPVSSSSYRHNEALGVVKALAHDDAVALKTAGGGGCCCRRSLWLRCFCVCCCDKWCWLCWMCRSSAVDDIVVGGWHCWYGSGSFMESSSPYRRSAVGRRRHGHGHSTYCFEVIVIFLF